MATPVSPKNIPVPSGYKVFGGTTAQWQTHDDRLKYRELGLEYTASGNTLMKAGVETPGDVGTPWSQLPYISGPQGPVGPSPDFEQNGNNIRFKKPDGTWGKWINTKGERGLPGEKGEPGDAAVDLPPATKTSLGGVSIGANLNITPQGCLSVDAASKEVAGVLKIGDDFLISPEGALSLVPKSKEEIKDGTGYALCEFYYFRNPKLRPGFQPCQGGVITDADQKYPEAWAFLQTEEGQALCTTEASWQALTRASWGAGTAKVSWNGVGGAPYFVQNLSARTLRLPDLRGMFVMAGTPGAVYGDTIMNITGELWTYNTESESNFLADRAVYSSGALYLSRSSYREGISDSGHKATLPQGFAFDASRVVPTGDAVRPRCWSALACTYLGEVPPQGGATA